MFNELHLEILTKKIQKTEEFKQKRLASVKEVVNFPSGHSEEDKIYTEIWSSNEYSVKFGRPGKEKFLEKRRNENDSTPTVWEGAELLDINATFGDIFNSLLDFDGIKIHKGEINLLACLFFRNAYMKDHTEYDNSFRYSPPQDVIKTIQEGLGNLLGLPIDVFLQYIEGIALNEDVKYWTLNNGGFKGNIGRINTMLTMVTLCTYLGGHIKLSEFLQLLIKGRGIAPITQKRVAELYPLLKL